MRNIILILCLLVLPVALLADSTSGSNDSLGRKATNFSGGVRIGNVPDNAATQSGEFPLGAPLAVFYDYYLNAPNASDDDYFVAAGATANVDNTVLTLLNQNNQTNTWNGVPFARNLLVTLSETDSIELTVIYDDIQNNRLTKTLSVSSGTTAESAWTARKVIKATVTDPTTTATLKLGFADKFGLPHPNYTGSCYEAAFDADGADHPIIDGTNFAITTDWTITAGLPDTASADPIGTVNLTASDTDPDATIDYMFRLPAHQMWRSGPVVTSYPTSAWSFE